MIWVEMSKDETHGGGEWGFTKCLWSPAYKLVNGTRRLWAYWDSLMRVREGDIILHLRGDSNSKFLGHSIADSDGFITTFRPPTPGSNWEYADTFYRVNLKNYEPFDQTIELSTLLIEKENQLMYYFNINKAKNSDEKKLLFFVIQNGKLRRQNGAYLSEVDRELYNILFGNSINSTVRERNVNGQSNTYESHRTLPIRVGQSDFSKNVRDNFEHICCFPNCEVSDRSFLVGAHIARWSDNPELRGETSNGLCLCLFHDKAFEIGLFTLDDNLSVSVNIERLSNYHSPINQIIEYNGQPIKKSRIPISTSSLRYHWTRIGFKPCK
ncbi:HNH endonuclease [Paenibacillus thiaminolyticus]|uniref:HNH endonuclease n=1 Tax=Paenibacillus thiaminolyticus TaxID=49283 RepID=UPI0011C3B089|nr:HNH endonuclease [Paenibacillus thiaminolyticus]